MYIFIFYLQIKDQRNFSDMSYHRLRVDLDLQSELPSVNRVKKLRRHLNENWDIRRNIFGIIFYLYFEVFPVKEGSE